MLWLVLGLAEHLLLSGLGLGLGLGVLFGLGFESGLGFGLGFGLGQEVVEHLFGSDRCIGLDDTRENC